MPNEIEIHKDGMRNVSVRALQDLTDEFDRLGESYRKTLGWSKFSKRWGILRRNIQFLFDPMFERLCEVASKDLDFEVVRVALIKKLEWTKKCPKCKQIGTVFGEYGFRKVNGKLVPQSWCRRCRK